MMIGWNFIVIDIKLLRRLLNIKIKIDFWTLKKDRYIVFFNITKTICRAISLEKFSTNFFSINSCAELFSVTEYILDLLKFFSTILFLDKIIFTLLSTLILLVWASPLEFFEATLILFKFIIASDTIFSLPDLFM